MAELSSGITELPTIDDWFAGDSRRLIFQVVVDGSGKELEGDDLNWRLFESEYATGEADAVLSDEDQGVEIRTDPYVDPANGEFQVLVDKGVTEDFVGEYWQRPVVETVGETEQTWRGKIIFER